MVVNTDPSSEQHSIVVTCIVAPIVSTVFVTIRVWTRAFISRSVGWDDYAAVIAWLLCIAYSILVGLATNYGFGWHAADISPDLYSDYYQWCFMSSTVYLLALFAYKFTILLLYLRLFGVDQKFRYYTWALMFFVFGYLFTNLLTMVFGCTPIHKYWDKKTPGHCLDTYKTDLAYGSMNFISDLFIFVLPLPMVWRLQLSRRGKIGVTIVFMGGAIAFIAATVRFSLLVHKWYSHDTTWYSGKNFLWMVLEVNTGLICGCIPALKPFFKHLASNGFLRLMSGEMVLHPKNNASPGRRSDHGSHVRRNAGAGESVIGDNEIELSHSAKALVLGEDV